MRLSAFGFLFYAFCMPTTQLPIAPVLKHVDSEFDASVKRLCDLLRIPSISTDPAYNPQTRQAAQWCSDELKKIGFDSSVRDTPGHPMVVAHFTPKNATDAPHILYYGHYDVQPPDPLELWDSKPFEPAIVNGPHGKRVVARVRVTVSDAAGNRRTLRRQVRLVL